MDIYIRRIKGTPYKVVVGTQEKIIGAFDHGFYVTRENMDDRLKNAIVEFCGKEVEECVI